MNRRYKVRFHLGAGVNFGKWRVENTETTEVAFYSPKDVLISMIDCKLYNQKGAATKIYNGQNKTVCAWIMCKNAWVFNANDIASFKKYIKEEGMTNVAQYNPRITPYWRDKYDNNIDKNEYGFMITDSIKLLTKKPWE